MQSRVRETFLSCGVCSCEGDVKSDRVDDFPSTLPIRGRFSELDQRINMIIAMDYFSLHLIQLEPYSELESLTDEWYYDVLHSSSTRYDIITTADPITIYLACLRNSLDSEK